MTNKLGYTFWRNTTQKLQGYFSTTTILRFHVSYFSVLFNLILFFYNLLLKFDENLLLFFFVSLVTHRI